VFGREGSHCEYWGAVSCVEECDEEGGYAWCGYGGEGREDDACATPMRVVTRKQLRAFGG
jgi:hypothetical protein